ncbi:nuclear autoantigen Sp-100-like [Hoplias malabaricus]|uniref:nuclear autoantigen Sp-100-like n=1 Tax=Hoplias malabaricus TaxID=27720 RepID=UPI0034623C51
MMDSESDTDENSDSDWVPEQNQMKSRKRRRMMKMVETDTDSDSLSEKDQRITRSHAKRKEVKRSTIKNNELSPSQIPIEETATMLSSSNSSERQSLGENSKRKSMISVTCGHKKGMLCKEKFDKSEPCILSGEEWFTPPEFEKLGGRERCKKWKTSILGKINLQTLIKVGLLPSSSFKQRKTTDGEPECRSALLPSSCVPIGSSSHSVTRIKVEEDRNDEDGSFPVTCCKGQGTLYKHLFATGSWGHCIRTEDSWLTPQQFLSQNKEHGNWKQDIYSHGKPLQALMEEGVLINQKDKYSDYREENLQNENNDDVCFKSHSGDKLLGCDEFPQVFRFLCHNPPLQENTLGCEREREDKTALC